MVLEWASHPSVVPHQATSMEVLQVLLAWDRNFPSCWSLTTVGTVTRSGGGNVDPPITELLVAAELADDVAVPVALCSSVLA